MTSIRHANYGRVSEGRWAPPFAGRTWLRNAAATLLCLVALLTSTPHSRAQHLSVPALPTGWTYQATDVLILHSAPRESPEITVLIPLVIPAITDLKNAFENEVPVLLEEFIGSTQPTHPPLPLPPSDWVSPGLRLSSKAHSDEGVTARVETTGYLVPGGMQLMIIVWAEPEAEDHPHIAAARNLVEEWRSLALVLTPDLLGQLSNATDALGAPTEASTTNADERVHDVIYFLRVKFDAENPARAGEPQYVTALLTTDGRAFENEGRAPAAFDPASRPQGSPGVGRWRRDGEAYALDFADGSQGIAVAKAAKTLPGEPGMALAGAYRAAPVPGETSLPDDLKFFEDLSVTLGPTSTSPRRSARYRIERRTFTIENGADKLSYLFGYAGAPTAPDVLIIGARVYLRGE